MDPNWRPTQGSGPAAAAADPPPAGGDWRAQLQPEARGRIVDKILETLKNRLPVSVSVAPEALNELQKIAAWFEQKVYTEATSQYDYLRKISLKLLSMETQRQQAAGNAQLIPNQNNPAPGLHPQGSNEAQTSAVPLMSQQQARQPNASTSVQAYSLTNIRQNLPGVNQTSTMQTASVIPQNTMNNGLAQGTSQDVYDAQRQMAGRQQQQQSQQLIYHQHQQPSLQSQQPNIPLQQQQQQLMGQQPNLQQNQLMGQQNGAVMMQQQQRLAVQSNNLLNVQQTHQMLSQQYLPLYQPQQLGSQANMSSLQQHQQNQQQQQLFGTVPNVSNMQWMHMQQTKAQQPQQQHAQQPSMGLMQPQFQHNQLQQLQHLMPQFQSQPNQLQEQLRMQQQSSMQQRLQTSGAMLLQQNNMDQQNQFIQAQRGLQEVSSSTSADSTAQTGYASTGDWQEEIHQMIKRLKDQYFAELSELFNKMCVKLQHVDSIIPPQISSEQYDRMKSFKTMLERILQMLQIGKSSVQPAVRDKVPRYEKHIISILNSQRKPVQPQIQQQFQPPPGHAGAGDWQEEIYQMIKRLKDQYFAELSELFNKMCVKLQHVDSIIPPQISSEQYDKMKSFKIMLERILQMLQIGKSSVQPSMRDNVPRYEKQIISILNSQRKPVQPQIQQQFQPPAD
ncbi:mediator of RNA polymerase II transcription subunit 15a-like isoform X2 [Triticum dicoccoides]|nr:mediator of RNA polymerase II transcription subunit 15a-like isoform X2 [Triticum dicoccoides]